MKKIFLTIFVFLFLPSFVSAYTAENSITSDTTWSPTHGVYVIESYFSVASGTTLTIEPGTIIKSRATGYGGPGIYGKIIAHGTSETPIYFTSFYNDDIGGDTDGYGPTNCRDGLWQGLYFKPGSEGVFDYINLSCSGYGGYGYGNYVGIENDGGNLTIDHSNIHDNFKITSNGAGGTMTVGYGIYIKSGVLSITNSVIDNNMMGIRVDSGATTISNNVIKNNDDSTGYSSGYGIYITGNESKLTLLNNVFSDNGRTAFIEAPAEFIHSGNTSSDLKRRAFQISGSLSHNLTLSADDLPYIIEYLTIPAGYTLTLEPGVIIKMEDRYTNGSMNIQGGNLIAKGTKDKKIYITSLKDDSVGGDTNGDGGDTTPAPRNWASVFLENGSKAEFDNVVVSYGGYNWNGEYLNIAAAIYQRGADFSVSNSVFAHNAVTDIFQDAGTTNITKSKITDGNYGIWFRGGNITISQSILTNHVGLAVYNESVPSIDARNNWWGSADGPKDVSTTTPTGSGSFIFGNILYIPFLSAPPSENPIINPVIIIPGIMGSAKKNGELLIDPILHTYDDLIATLEANGYEKNKNLFDFPYEWRDSNIQTANLLKEKISAVKTACEIAQGTGAISQALGQTDCSKVDLIAHSMGGLVAREYIQSGQYNHDIDQLIFLGTPHKGSPEAYLQWEAGESDRDRINIFMNMYFTAEAARNGFINVFDYIRNRPILSVKELLPTFDYLKDKDTGILRTYPNNYPTNSFLENLNSNISNLLNSGVKIANIVGNSGNNTIEKIRVVPSTKTGLWENGQPENFYQPVLSDNGLERGRGDNTVTINGAILDSSITNKEVPSTHNRIPTEQSNFVFKTLTNKDSTTNIDTGSNIDVKVLLLQLLSPIDVVITAPNGQKVGKNFATGQEYNEIASAFYSGFNNGDEEYITIPNPLDGDYKIEVQGTGNGGEYGVLTSLISENTSAATETTGITQPNQITELNVTLDNQNPTNLQTERVITLEVLKNDINGSYDLGWIKDKKVRDSLIKQAEKIIRLEKRIEKIIEKLPNGSKKEKRIEKVEIKIDKILAKLLKKELDLLLKKQKITKEAFDLLKADIKYLLENN